MFVHRFQGQSHDVAFDVDQGSVARQLAGRTAQTGLVDQRGPFIDARMCNRAGIDTLYTLRLLWILHRRWSRLRDTPRRWHRRGFHRRRARGQRGFLHRPERQHAQQGHLEPGARRWRNRQITPAGDGELIKQLHLLSRHGCGQCGDLGIATLLHRDVFGNELLELHAMQRAGNFIQHAGKIWREFGQAIDLGHQPRAVAGMHRLNQREHLAALDRAEHGAHFAGAHGARAIGDGLIEQ